MILNAYEEIIEKDNANVSEWRPRIEHAQIFAQEDFARLGRLGGVNNPRVFRLFACETDDAL